MMNKVRKSIITGMATAMAFCGMSMAASPANAFVPDCRKSGDTLTCVGVYQGGANGVQFVRVQNGYKVAVYMRTTDSPANVCVESGGYIYVDPATRMAGIIVLSNGTWFPASPVPC